MESQDQVNPPKFIHFTVNGVLVIDWVKLWQVPRSYPAWVGFVQVRILAFRNLETERIMVSGMCINPHTTSNKPVNKGLGCLTTFRLVLLEVRLGFGLGLGLGFGFRLGFGLGLWLWL